MKNSRSLTFKRAQDVKFSIVRRIDGAQIFYFRRYCKRPYATKAYKTLLQLLDSGYASQVIVSPANNPNY